MKKHLIICTLVEITWVARAQDAGNFNFSRVDKTTVSVKVTGAAEKDFSNGGITEYPASCSF